MIDARGGIHFSYGLFPIDLGGTGTDGTVFKIVGAERESIHLHWNEVSSSATFTTTSNLVSLGPGDNFISKSTVHVTVNANGDVSVELLRERSVCVG